MLALQTQVHQISGFVRDTLPPEIMKAVFHEIVQPHRWPGAHRPSLLTSAVMPIVSVCSIFAATFLPDPICCCMNHGILLLTFISTRRVSFTETRFVSRLPRNVSLVLRQYPTASSHQVCVNSHSDKGIQRCWYSPKCIPAV